MSVAEQQRFAFVSGGQAILPVRRNLVIEAGAGTGKTTAIVAEVLKLLLGGEEVAPERIVLVTFTEKAAAEIADRIHSALEEIQRQADRNEPIRWPAESEHALFTTTRRDECRRAVGRQLAQIDALRSQTIHSFCQSLLRQFPIEAGIDPQFRIIEGFDRSLLYDQIFDAWVDDETRAHPNPQAARDWEALLDQCTYVFLARGMIFTLLEKRHLLLDMRYDIGSVEEFEPALVSALRAVPVRDEPPPPCGSGIEAWIEYFAPCAKELRAINLNRDKRDRKALEVLRPKSGFCVYDTLVSHRAAEAALSLTRRFVEYLDREKRARGVLDFDDLLLRTRAMLDHPAVLERVRNQFDFIFVDEFQDTDRIQAEILRRIASDASGAFVPGKIAVVGDPKQSIYAFRRADPETYAAFTQHILGTDDPRLLLDQYRSTPQLVEVLNQIGGPLFDEGDRDANVFQPEYHALHAARTGGSDIEPLLFIDGGDDPEKEAEAIVAWIQSQGESDLRKFALLFRRRTRMETYLDVFDRRGLAYVVPPLGLFLETPAAVDLLAVLRAIAYGYDRGALISAARSPHFALTDSEIAAGILSDEDGPWKRFIETMRALRDASKNLTVTATIDHLIATTGIEAIYDDRSRRHLEQVRAIAFTYDQKAGGSLRQFVEEIARRRETPDEVDASLLDDTTNAVRILTIHGAKGLEFERVILPDIEFTTNSSGVDVFTVEEPRSLVLRNGLETLSGICRFSDNRQLKEIGSLRDKAETRRLFYVAITRAKSQVVICTNAKKVTNNGFGRFINELFPARSPLAVPLADTSGCELRTANREPLAECIIPTPQPIVEKLSAAEIKIARAGMANRAAGILLHRVLERWDGKADVGPLIAALAIEQAADQRAIDLVRRRIAQISGSPTLRRILAAETIGREMPVAFIDEAGSLVERRIDRVIREDGRTVVIDYKSGEPSEARMGRDREQVALYCRLMTQMTGRPCDGLLWYIDVENDQAIMV